MDEQIQQIKNHGNREAVVRNGEVSTLATMEKELLGT